MHLSLSPPVARTAEVDWLEAQGRVLSQVRALVAELGMPPVIIAGDIFDRWNAGPELINWAIANWVSSGRVYAVPGQHDLPMHNLEDVKKSAYWTLVEAGKIVNIDGCWDGWIVPGKLHCLGFPWGRSMHELEGREDYPDSHEIQLAVAHSYIWRGSARYDTATEATECSQYGRVLKGYDVAVFGDNHIHFAYKMGGCVVYNCGCLIPRRSDERTFRSSVGLLMQDGSVQRQLLDNTADVWLYRTSVEQGSGIIEWNGVADDFEGLQSDADSFVETLRRVINEPGVGAGARGVILRALEVVK